MKTLKLNEKNKNFNKTLQENLKDLYKLYGNVFNIKFNNINIKVNMKYSQHEFTKMNYYSIFYDIEKRDFDLYPMKIDFIDRINKKINDNCYITDIHKTDNISGSDIIKLVLALCKLLKVNKAYIYDGAEVKCKNNYYDISYIKLLEKNNTFYMKYGFDFDISPGDWFSTYFTRKEDKKEYIMNLIKECKKVTNESVYKSYVNLLELCVKAIKNNENIIQHNKYIVETENTWISNVTSPDILNLIKDCGDMIKLVKNQKGYLYQTMIKIFNDSEKCIDFDIINKNIVENKAFKYTYKNHIIDMSIIDCFKLLKSLRYSMYSIVLN